MMVKRKKIRGIVCLMTALAMAFLLLPAMEPASAVSWMEPAAKTLSKSSVKLSWGNRKKAVKKAVRWKVKAAVIKDEGGVGRYKIVKTLKKGSKTCTLKKLQADKTYNILLLGYVKKKGKLKLAYRGETEAFTGIAAPEWDEYANSDYYYGTDRIDLALYNVSDGIEARGYEIFRRDAEGADDSWQMIADLNRSDYKGKSEVVCQDKDVSPGMRYLYKVRSYITGSDPGDDTREYSDFSEELSMAAVNQVGRFTYKEVSRGKDQIVICLSSAQYNADTVFNAYDTFSLDGKPGDDDLVRIIQFSRDGKNWKDLIELNETEVNASKDPVKDVNFTVLEGGADLWLRFASTDPGEDTDLTTAGMTFDADEISYNGLPSIFHLAMDESGTGSGTAEMNPDYIH